MRIIDEKGRLFKKINVIDFTVILFVFFLLPLFYFGNKFLKEQRRVVKVVGKKISDVTIDIYVTFINLDPEVSGLISAQDKELDDNSYPIGEILEVGKVESNFIVVKLSDTDIITKEDRGRKQVTAKLRITGRLIDSEIWYKQNKVKIGYNITFKTPEYEAEGLVIPEPIVQAEGASRSGFVPITIDIRFVNLSPEVAGSISSGDFEVGDNAETIAKVLSIGVIEPYVYKVDLGGGNYITKVDPQKKQLHAKMEISGVIDGNTIYFRRRRIALDSGIEFNTSKYKVDGVITREPVPIKTSAEIPIAVGVRFVNLTPEVAGLISSGDFEAGDNAETIAKVLSIGMIEPYAYKVDSGGGNYITKVDPQKMQLRAKMEILGEVHGNAFYFRGKRIALDSGIEFNTSRYKVEGVITREPVPIEKFDLKFKLLKIKCSNLPPELVDAIKIGDEEVDIMSGGLIARVEKIDAIVGSQYSKLVIPDNQQLVFVDNRMNKDVVLLIRASCNKAQKGLLFKETPIKISTIISLQTKKYDIIGQIISIEEIAD